MSLPHIPVLLNEVLEAFAPLQLRFFVDCTLGAGGHSEAILKSHPEIEKLVGIDQDPDARILAAERLKAWQGRVVMGAGNFQGFSSYLDKCGIEKVDGILMDLGVSSMQLDRPEKGFSFMQEGPLDMRMDPSNPLTAAEIVNTWPEKELGAIFRDCGEEKHWRQAAHAIVVARVRDPIVSTKDLEAVLLPVLGWKSKKGINPLTLIFQGLRIFVNGELQVLEKTLPIAVQRLNPGGRLAVISFHSLEDRRVKQFFQYAAADKESTTGLAGLFLNKEPSVRLLSKKPLVPSEREIEMNPRSRSARLRVIEKLK